MTLKITFLGTGGSTLTRERSAPGILINDELLLECGDGITHKLIKLGVIGKIKTIGISHSHCDHVIGLVALLWHYWILGRKRKLEIIGPSGIKETVNKMLSLVHTPEPMRSCELKFIEVESTSEIQEIESNFNISCITVEHDPMTIAFRIDEKGRDKSVCYGGDTRPSENLIKLAKDCDLLITEATFPNNLSDLAHQVNHSTPIDAGQMAARARCKKLALVHISAHFSKQIDDFKREAKEVFKKDIIIPEDSTVIEL